MATIFGSLANIKDNGIHVGQKIHSCNRRRAADGWVWEGVELEVANVSRQHFDCYEGTVRAFQHLSELRLLVFPRSLALGGKFYWAEVDSEMLVMAHCQ